MAAYTVHQPPLRKGETSPQPGRFVFVRDGFYVWGFLLSVLWMLRHRLWLVAILFVALMTLIEAGLYWAGVGSGAQALIGLALCFLVGLEGATLRRWTLARRGYRPAGVVIADGREEAEERFFLHWTENQPSAPPRAPAEPLMPLMPRKPASADVLGSFPQPEPRR